MFRKRIEQVLDENRRIILIPEKLKPLIDLYNLLPRWMERKYLDVKSEVGINWYSEFYNEKNYTQITAEWTQKAYENLLSLNSFLPEMQEQLKIWIQDYIDFIEMEETIVIVSPENKNEHLLETEEYKADLEFYRRELEKLPQRIKKFISYVLREIEPDISVSASFEYSVNKYGLPLLTEYVYESVVRHEKVLNTSWNFEMLIDIIKQHPSSMQILENSKRRVKTKQFIRAKRKYADKDAIVKQQLMIRPVFVNYIIDNEGIAHAQTEKFHEAINGVEVWRIRECLYCLDIFWAGRLDKFCCSKPCNRAENLRLLPPPTDEERIKRNEQRKKIYERKKELQERQERHRLKELQKSERKTFY
jgi:hypothetical protein